MTIVTQSNNPTTLFDGQTETGYSDIYQRGPNYPIKLTCKFQSTVPTGTAIVDVYSGSNPPNTRIATMSFTEAEESYTMVVRNTSDYLTANIRSIAGANSKVTLTVEPIED